MWVRIKDDAAAKLRNEHVLIRDRNFVIFLSTSPNAGNVIIPCKNEEAAKAAFDLLISRLAQVGLLVDLRSFIAEESAQEVSSNGKGEGCAA